MTKQTFRRKYCGVVRKAKKVLILDEGAGGVTEI